METYRVGDYQLYVSPDGDGGFRVQLQDRPGIHEIGATKTEALGKMVITLSAAEDEEREYFAGKMKTEAVIRGKVSELKTRAQRIGFETGNIDFEVETAKIELLLWVLGLRDEKPYQTPEELLALLKPRKQ